MESCSNNEPIQEICWFCKKDRHSECMKQIPISMKSKGPDDCSFANKMIPFKCTT